MAILVAASQFCHSSDRFDIFVTNMLCKSIKVNSHIYVLILHINPINVLSCSSLQPVKPTVKHAAPRTHALIAWRGINWTTSNAQVLTYTEICLVIFPHVIN